MPARAAQQVSFVGMQLLALLPRNTTRLSMLEGMPVEACVAYVCLFGTTIQLYWYAAHGCGCAAEYDTPVKLLGYTS
jgi:hypothetical protein